MAADVARRWSRCRGRHRVVEVPVDGLDEALRALPVKLSTMGRDLDADHATSWPPRRPGRQRRTPDLDVTAAENRRSGESGQRDHQRQPSAMRAARATITQSGTR
jgi:hypothetical protein